MTTARDWEFGDRPTCNACGCELDPETDTHHDGYRGSPHAHNGRGSYGLSSKHYVFSELCECCRESRTAPQRRILDYTRQVERLECGHNNPTPTDRFGQIRPGNKRRCEKCRLAYAADFELSDADKAQIKEQLADELRRKQRLQVLREVNAQDRDAALRAKLSPVYDNDNH